MYTSTVSQTAPLFYAVLYECPCGCSPRKRDVDYVSRKDEETLENPAHREAVRLAAEKWADELRAKGYLNVRVEPRYATPDIEVN